MVRILANYGTEWYEFLEMFCTNEILIQLDLKFYPVVQKSIFFFLYSLALSEPLRGFVESELTAI